MQARTARAVGQGRQAVRTQVPRTERARLRLVREAPVARRRRPRRRFLPEVLSDDEVRALMGACSPRSPVGVRNRALIVVLQSRIVELRFFGGLSVEETAQVIDLSPATVKREWTLARAWLYREIGDGESTGS